MDDVHRMEMKQIAEGLDCPKGLQCYHSDFEKLGQTKDIGQDAFLESLGGECKGCPLSLSFGYGYLCTCPLHVYIMKHFNK